MGDVQLSAAQRNRMRRTAGAHELEGDEGELNVVPFLDIIANVTMFVLATIAVALTAEIPARPPGAVPTGPRPPVPTLALNVVVLDEGFLVSALGQRIAPGCAQEGEGLAVTRGDYAGLTACVTKLKQLSPYFATDREVTIAANGDVPYQAIIDTVEAVRRAPTGEPLYPDVYLGVPR